MDKSLSDWCSENHSDILQEWDYSKNTRPPQSYTPFSNKKVWWKCKKGHSWESVVYNRTRAGTGCPYCSGLLAVRGVNDFATVQSKLLYEWDYERNYGIDPSELTAKSSMKVWWRCSEGHLWQATIYSRVAGTGCPFCAGNLVIPGETDLATLEPEVAKQWNYQRNGDLKPTDVKPHSLKKVWWICSKGHEWQAGVSSHVSSKGCPVCSGRLVIEGVNDLETTDCRIASEWNYSKNGDLTPRSVTRMSNKNVWWICSKGHEWKTDVSHRVMGTGCPYCANKKVLKGYNDLSNTDPEICSSWNYERNKGLEPTDYTRGSGKAVWWRCEFGHEWKSPIDKRVAAKGCPICQSELKMSFGEKAIAFYLYQLYDVIENYKIPGHKGLEIDVYLESLHIGIEYDGAHWHKNVNRDLKKNEICSALGIKLIRLREEGCPEIAGCVAIPVLQNSNKSLGEAIERIIDMVKEGSNTPNSISVDLERDESAILAMKSTSIKERSLEKEYPALFKEVHPTKNGNLDPRFIASQSNRKIWWLCSNGHEWQALVSNRVKGRGCPYCGGKMPIKGTNNLQSRNPGLCLEWSPRNKFRPDEVLEYSNKRAWWICSKGHEWQAEVANRSNGSGCPYCSGNKVESGFNDIFTSCPGLKAEWDYDNNDGLDPQKLTAHSNKRANWVCSKGHRWNAVISSRASGCGCPFCAGQRIQPGENDLASQRPDLLKEWNYAKNESVKPTQISPNSVKKVWWIDEFGHEWQAMIRNRRDGKGKCPVCRKNKFSK